MWHNAEEELPEQEKSVIGWCADWTGQCYMTIVYLKGEEWYFGDRLGGHPETVYSDEGSHVRHWQHWPEPPKEG